MNELIEKSKNGDIEAYTELIKNIEKDLYRIARTRLNNNDDINDAIQNTMINIFQHIKKLRDTNLFKSWAIKILLNECKKIYKQNSKKERIVEKSVQYSSFNQINELTTDYNNFLYFENMLSNLESDEQLIFTLYYKDNYSCKDISKITNIKENTIKSKLARGRNKIKEMLLKEEF